MGLLSRAFAPRASARNPLDDRWYTPYLGITSDAGVAVTPETVLNCGIVLAAVRFKAEAVAVCRARVVRVDGEYRYTEPQHPVHRLLRYPNRWQSGFQWSRQMAMWLAIYGIAPNRIVDTGSGYYAGELRPLSPDRFRVLGQQPDGSRRFGYRPPDGREEEILSEDEVHLYEDLSLDGVQPLKTYQLIRNAVGVALAAEQYTGTFLRKGTRLSGILSVPPGVNKEGRREIAEEWDVKQSGANNAGATAVVPSTVTFTPMSNTNRDAQFVELQNQQVEAILRALGVPGVVVGYSGDKASTYASAEAFFASGIRQTLMPIIANMEERDEMVLLAPYRASGAEYQVKRNMNVFERANIQSRFSAYAQATGGASWMTPNEVRAYEDENPIDGGEDLVQRLNTSAYSEADPANEASEPEDDGSQREVAALARIAVAAESNRTELERLASIARDLAERNARAAVQREAAAILGRGGSKPAVGAAARYASDPTGWEMWVHDFYAKHARYVAERMAIDEAAAVAYADRQRDALLSGGVAVVTTWEEDAAQHLAALALGHEIAA